MRPHIDADNTDPDDPPMPALLRADPAVVPLWAQVETRSGSLAAVPWVMAAIGWIVAGALLIYSHGQSDRLRTDHQDMQERIDSLHQDVVLARTVQDYLYSPGIRALPFRALIPVAGAPVVTLVLAPHYLHALVIARGLARPVAPGHYVVWAREASGRLINLGGFTTSDPRSDGATIVVGKVAIDRYRSLNLDIEQSEVVTAPTGPMLFTVHIQQAT